MKFLLGMFGWVLLHHFEIAVTSTWRGWIIAGLIIALLNDCIENSSMTITHKYPKEGA